MTQIKGREVAVPYTPLADLTSPPEMEGFGDDGYLPVPMEVMAMKR